ncbi:MAG: DUF2309 domain-containing protein, partial [Salinibacterium sp.]|nr:DUF2309 domain-containing protein [Salinibacterium sp.]
MSLEVRAAVTRATRAVTPIWPLSSFIAVNPLGGRESEDFTAAAIMRPLSEFLADHSTGRVNDADLAVALLNRIPAVADASGATLGGDAFTAVDLVVAELVRGDRRISPPSLTVTADPVDELVAKWVGAYLDPHPQWPMPNRDRGLWAAWRAMARYDPQLSAKA